MISFGFLPASASIMNDQMNLGRIEDQVAGSAQGSQHAVHEHLHQLLAELIRRRDFPDSKTRDFMAHALESIAQLPASINPPERVKALMVLATFYNLEDEIERSAEIAGIAVRMAIEGGFNDLEAQARSLHASRLRMLGNMFESLREFERSLEMTRQLGDGERAAKILNNLGNWYSDVGLYGEALALFERIARHFELGGDPFSMQMALDNGALAAQRLGEFKRAIELSERAAEVWVGEIITADDCLWLAQGAQPYCELLIQADRKEEALACARLVRVIANRSGMRQIELIADMMNSVAEYSLGLAGPEVLQRMVAQMRVCSLRTRCSSLEAAILAHEAVGELDRALLVQQELLALNRSFKFEEVRRALGYSPPEETEGAAKLARLGGEVERIVSNLLRIAIDQSLRLGLDHVQIFRVSLLAKRFAQSIGMCANEVATISLAAKLLDIGMIVIPDDLICKLRELSKGERGVFEQHAEFGAELLVNARLALLQPCVAIVRLHHERWDGTGPCGLAGASIPLAVRLIALCDAYATMRYERSGRPGPPALVSEEALQVIFEEADSKFDPALAVRFIQWFEESCVDLAQLDKDFEAEAQDNDYIRLRERIARLVSVG